MTWWSHNWTFFFTKTSNWTVIILLVYYHFANMILYINIYKIKGQSVTINALNSLTPVPSVLVTLCCSCCGAWASFFVPAQLSSVKRVSSALLAYGLWLALLTSPFTLAQGTQLSAALTQQRCKQPSSIAGEVWLLVLCCLANLKVGPSVC